MDSKDKALTDQRKMILDLKSVIPVKDKQIAELKKSLMSYESQINGTLAVSQSLIQEQELNNQLNLQIDTLKKQVESLQSEINSIKEMNLKLQSGESK